jgi:hypothetical protein
MLTKILAHAGEEHSNTVESISHSIDWYIALPIFFLVVAAIGYLAWIVSGKKIDLVAIVLSIVLLISGFTLFNISAAISVISITAGIIIAGALTFLGIAGDTKNLKNRYISHSIGMISYILIISKMIFLIYDRERFKRKITY